MENSVIYSGEIAELIGAHSEFLGDVADPGKSQQGYGYKYADLSQILQAARSTLSLYGLSMTQFPTFERYPKDQVMELPGVKGFIPHLIGEVIIETTLAHKSGQYMRGRLSIPVETMKGLSFAQAVGAAISYGRRYHASAILGIAQEDNDAALPRQDDAPNQPPVQNRQPQNQPPARQPAKPSGPAQVRVISEADADALRERIEAMGRDPVKFATAVSGVPTLNRLPATALDAAKRMLAKAEAKQAAASNPPADDGDPGAHSDPSADARAEQEEPDEGDRAAAKVA